MSRIGDLVTAEERSSKKVDSNTDLNSMVYTEKKKEQIKEVEHLAGHLSKQNNRKCIRNREGNFSQFKKKSH